MWQSIGLTLLVIVATLLCVLLFMLCECLSDHGAVQSFNRSSHDPKKKRGPVHIPTQPSNHAPAAVFYHPVPEAEAFPMSTRVVAAQASALKGPDNSTTTSYFIQILHKKKLKSSPLTLLVLTQQVLLSLSKEKLKK
ncbi:small integral membrane protein 13 isoform X2 [Tachyglossus aculeatus]|uniref:small integral membrane protein 13 isoform X2 n=1 Tax=Tachyglossus aculeatus TaxID=9261 RepID=UPI0018F6266A|nr:small integral membrane protein 13 isoform X2 [Tachyglossus aculeatus]